MSFLWFQQTKKNGVRNGIQLYKCVACKHQFRSTKLLNVYAIWDAYQNGKQTIQELAKSYHVSTSTIKRRPHTIEQVWFQPDLIGMSGFVHLDATYWGRNWGIMLALDNATGMPLYLAFIKSETTHDYKAAVDAIVDAGYAIRGIVIDGKQALFKEFSDYPIQMCQFHLLQIVRRYLTKKPKMNASKELLALCEQMIYLDEDLFVEEYLTWKEIFQSFIEKRTIHKNGKSYYLHRRLKSAMYSLEFYLPYLFTYQHPECEGMPNTNNKIEGTFTDVKKNLNNHSGMSIQNRKRFISGYFSDQIARGCF